MPQGLPKLVRDKIPDRIRADGKEPVYRHVGDQELIPLLGAKVAEEVRELAEAVRIFRSATDGREQEGARLAVLAEAADFWTAFDALLAQTGISHDTLSAIPAHDGHVPRELVRHAEDLANATPKKRPQAAANMRLAVRRLLADLRIPEVELGTARMRRDEERGTFEFGTLLTDIRD